MIEHLLERHLAGHRAGRVLDVGPGYGPFGRVACQLTGARHLTVVDVDKEVLRWQREESQKAGLQIDAIEALLTPSALAGALAGPYDVILCQEVLEHLTCAEEVLAALAAQLTPGGRLVITVPTALSERWLKWLNPAYMRDVPFGHVRMFDQHALRELAQGAGLEVLTLLPTQPHYFLTHTLMFGLRRPVAESTGRVVSAGWIERIAARVNAYSRTLFLRSSPAFWGRLLPRNYFLVATRR
jgi:cyclopropane fatty-acyl-phospholipid synthase-like methyltransferase